ncbi:MAG: pyridoxal-dependent decarboxylase [Bdellovibrionales bacterium]|jgi:glutamate/tyrosine decarboxylase-like PLP-dependent enzyme|nr:pyridoxal-dependent decarboxylase [Bdellovibrionales bacterium]
MKPEAGPMERVGTFRPSTMREIRERVSLELSDAPLESSTDLSQVMQAIRENSVPAASPYFMNQLFSGVSSEMLMAEHLIAGSRTTMATFEASPVFTAIELEVVSQLLRLVGWESKEQRPDDSHLENFEIESLRGLCVSGGSAANFMALHCARTHLISDFKQTGFAGRKLALFVSEDAHYSFAKACVALGFGTEALFKVEVDEHRRMSLARLEDAIIRARTLGWEPFFVSATAGTTVYGAFDPISDLADACERHGLWLHVDAAWGGPVLFANELRRRTMEGVEKADSISLDAHKLLGAGLTSSFFLTNHQGLLTQANDVSGGDYLFHDDLSHSVGSVGAGPDLGRISWQCGRRPEALGLWVLWKRFGRKGLGDLVEKMFSVRDEVVAWIHREPRLKLVCQPEFLNICVRVEPPSAYESERGVWSRHVREELRRMDFAMVNFSTDDEGDFLRLILANRALEAHHAIEILEAALAICSCEPSLAETVRTPPASL